MAEKNYGGTDFLSKDMLQTYFFDLSDRCTDEKEITIKNFDSEGDYCFYKNCGSYQHSKAADFIFMLCEYWKLSDEVKYTALEIFDSQKTAVSIASSSRYMELTNSCTETSKREEWDSSLKRLKKQMVIRGISSVSIASKISSHYKIVTLGKSISFLNDFGFNYNREVLIKSEMRILKTLDFRLHNITTPYHYVKILLELIARSDKLIPVHDLHDMCLLVLELYFLQRPFIFGKICNLNVSSAGIFTLLDESKKRLLLSVMNDVTLVATSIVACAAYIKSKTLSDKIILLSCAISGLPENDVTRLSCGILNLILEK